MHRGPLIDSGLFARLDDGEIDIVIAASQPETHKFGRKDILWKEGDIINGIGVMLSGILLCRRFQPDGKIQLLRIFEPAQLINLEAAVSRKRTSPVSVIGNSSGSYLWFARDALLANTAIPDEVIRTIQENILHYLADDSIRFMNKTDILARRTVRGRIFLFLTFLCNRHGNDVDIGMSQEEFAQYLCVDRSSLSMELNNMRRDGLIEFEGTNYHLNFPEHPKALLKKR